jgi:hypothetical protein
MGEVLSFDDVQLAVIDREGEPWFTAADVGRALGFASDREIRKLIGRHQDEFTPAMKGGVKLTPPLRGGEQITTILSLRGAHLVGMLARTARAAAFRRWVLDLIDQHLAQLKAAASAVAPLPAIPADEADWPRFALRHLPDYRADLLAQENPAIRIQRIGHWRRELAKYEGDVARLEAEIGDVRRADDRRLARLLQTRSLRDEALERLARLGDPRLTVRLAERENVPVPVDGPVTRHELADALVQAIEAQDIATPAGAAVAEAMERAFDRIWGGVTGTRKRDA